MSSDGLLSTRQNPRVVGLAYGLWLITTILGVLTFLAGREMLLRTYVRFFPGEALRFQTGMGSLSLVNSVVSIMLGILSIAIIIGGFEYQHRNLGHPQAWVMLARTFAVEIGILLLAWYV